MPGVISPADLQVAQRGHLDQLRSWQRFHDGPRKSDQPLLQSLAQYPDCVLVAGCQRSGTTMVTRLIGGSRGFSRLRLTKDDELDAALALAGYVDLPADRRYCFQTTYLNASFPEYRAMGPGQRLIWVLRNPYSVVYSMVHNWGRFALDELYESCGMQRATLPRQRRARLPWPLGPSVMEKACLAYSGKISQILQIRQFVPPAQLLLLDYDQLVQAPARWLPEVFGFVGEYCDPSYASAVRADSVAKAARLSRKARYMIDQHCAAVYEECAALLAQRN